MHMTNKLDIPCHADQLFDNKIYRIARLKKSVYKGLF